MPITKILPIILILILVSVGVLYVYRVSLNRRFSTVKRGRVYRSGALRPGLLKKRVEQLGIRTVIDLRRDTENGKIDREKQLLAQMAVQHIHLRSSQVPKQPVIEAFLDIMSKDENYPVLIHCSHGRGRAALFSAVYLMEHYGYSNLFTCVSLFWNPLLGSFNPLSRKGKFILAYSPKGNQPPKLNFYRKAYKAPT